MFFQQDKKFRIETHFLVMGFLILDVSNNHRRNRSAHAKCPVPCCHLSLYPDSLVHREGFALIVATAFATGNIGGT